MDISKLAALFPTPMKAVEQSEVGRPALPRSNPTM